MNKFSNKKSKFFTLLNNLLRKLRFKKSYLTGFTLLNNLRSKLKIKDFYLTGFKLILILNLFLFLIIGIGMAVHYLFFTRMEIKIDNIKWIDEFKITITEIELKDGPCFFTINPKNLESEIISEREFQIQKQNIRIGECTNSRILIPLRIESKIEKHQDLFFIPQFRIRAEKREQTEEKDLRLRAGFSLYLLSDETNISSSPLADARVTDNCPDNREKIQGKDFVLCSINISSSNVKSFSITERRKNILANEIIAMTDKHNYILVLKVSPCLKTVRNLSSFSIIIENIVPELIIDK